MCRDYNEGGSPAEGGEGSAQPQDMTPQQQHQQYLGDSRPELVQFPDIQWAGTPIPGKQVMKTLSILILITSWWDVIFTPHL